MKIKSTMKKRGLKKMTMRRRDRKRRTMRRRGGENGFLSKLGSAYAGVKDSIQAKLPGQVRNRITDDERKMYSNDNADEYFKPRDTTPSSTPQSLVEPATRLTSEQITAADIGKQMDYINEIQKRISEQEADSDATSGTEGGGKKKRKTLKRGGRKGRR